MKQDHFHDFFSQSSRIILFVPFIILFVGLSIRYGVFGKPSVPQRQENIRGKAQYAPTPKDSFSFALPFACDAQTKESSISAFRNQNDFLIHSETKKRSVNFLVNGDCIYFWEKNMQQGERKCGIGQYINLLNTMSNMGMVNADTLISYVPQGVDMSSYGITLAEIQSVVRTCKNKAVPDKRIFDLPKGVSFSEEKN